MPSRELRHALNDAHLDNLGVVACLGAKDLRRHNIDPTSFRNELKEHYNFTLELNSPPVARIKAVYDKAESAPATVAKAMGLLTDSNLRVFLSSMGPRSKTILTLGDFRQYGRIATIGRVLDGGKKSKEFLEFLEACGLTPKN